MPQIDIKEAKKVWLATRNNIKSGRIVEKITERNERFTYFPKKTENRVSHVRPHARNANDTYPLPKKDKKTGLTEYTKHCFWLNARYVKDEVYNK